MDEYDRHSSPPPPPPPLVVMTLPLGHVLPGQLQVTGVLGQGAYATVYRAHHAPSQCDYAVKLLSTRSFHPDDELRLHARLHHPHIVRLERVIELPAAPSHPANATAVVLEYLPQDLFSAITSPSAPLYPPDLPHRNAKIRHVFLQLCHAVAHCHARHVYHRDLKPENILVAHNGWCLKLADFGLATARPRSADFACGSPFYMSPECAAPSSSSYASAPNDIWALGVILVNLIAARNPWTRAHPSDPTYAAFRAAPARFLPSILPVSPAANALLLRIFHPDPARRITLPALIAAVRVCPRFDADPSPSPSPSPSLHAVDPPVDAPPRDPALLLTPPLSPSVSPPRRLSHSDSHARRARSRSNWLLQQQQQLLLQQQLLSQQQQQQALLLLQHQQQHPPPCTLPPSPPPLFPAPTSMISPPSWAQVA